MIEKGQARFVGGPADGEVLEVVVKHGSPATMRVMRRTDSPSSAWHTYLLADPSQEAGLWTYRYSRGFAVALSPNVKGER